MLATARTSSSSCTGAMTSELSMGSIEAIINQNEAFPVSVHISPISCHEHWNSTSCFVCFWCCFFVQTCPCKTDYILTWWSFRQCSYWSNPHYTIFKMFKICRVPVKSRNGMANAASWYSITFNGWDKPLGWHARVHVSLGTWRIVFHLAPSIRPILSGVNFIRWMRPQSILRNFATHMVRNVTF